MVEDFGLSVSRNEIKINGYEATADLSLTNEFELTVSYSYVDGEERGQNAQQFQKSMALVSHQINLPRN